MSADKAPRLSCGVCDGLLTGLAGLPPIARLGRILGLPWKFQQLVHVKRAGAAAPTRSRC